MDSLKLGEYGRQLKELSRFKNNLRSKIKDDLFLHDNLRDINYLALKKIYPINITVKNNESSIEYHALKVVGHFGLKKNRNAFYLSFSIDGSNKTKQDSATVFFQNYFTQVGSVPKQELEKLKEDIVSAS
jgi:hypothetical protein